MDQGSVIGGFNYAKKVGKNQVGGVFCIQTKNKKAKQKRCLIRYNPLERFGFGSSVYSKIEKADRYLSKLEDSKCISEYIEILRSFVRETPTLRKRITGHNTYTDILSRQARKKIKKFGLEQKI